AEVARIDDSRRSGGGSPQASGRSAEKEHPDALVRGADANCLIYHSPMADPRRTHYDELGVPRQAKPLDVQRAYAKYRKEADRETAIPNPQRDRRVQAAYDTLSDPDKREAYDESLRSPEQRKALAARRGSSKGVLFLVAAVVVAAAAAGGFFLMKRGGPPPADTELIANAATLAVGRVDTVDLTGKGGPVGLAFAIDENLVATTCNGITPMSQLTL